MLILICSLCLSCTFDYFGLSDSVFIVILLALPSFLPFRDFLEGETHESWDRDDRTRHVKGAVIRSWQVKQPACHPNREVMIQIRVKSRGKKYYTNQVSQESIWGGSQGKWHETRNRKSLGCLFNQRQEEKQKRIEGIEVRIEYMARFLTCKGSSNDGCNSLRKKQ